MENSNRRRFTRLSLQKNAVLRYDKKEQKVNKIINLSVGGCLLYIDEPIDEGMVCTLVIELHHMAPNLEVSGEVIRSNEEQTTLRFISVSPENLKHLQNVIRYNAEQPDIIEDEIKKHPGLL